MKFIKTYWIVIAIIIVITIALYLDYGLRQRQIELENTLIELNKQNHLDGKL